MFPALQDIVSVALFVACGVMEKVLDDSEIFNHHDSNEEVLRTVCLDNRKGDNSILFILCREETSLCVVQCGEWRVFLGPIERFVASVPPSSCIHQTPGLCVPRCGSHNSVAQGD